MNDFKITVAWIARMAFITSALTFALQGGATDELSVLRALLPITLAGGFFAFIIMLGAPKNKGGKNGKRKQMVL